MLVETVIKIAEQDIINKLSKYGKGLSGEVQTQS